MVRVLVVSEDSSTWLGGKELENFQKIMQLLFDLDRSLKVNPPNYTKGINHIRREAGRLEDLITKDEKASKEGDIASLLHYYYLHHAWEQKQTKKSEGATVNRKIAINN